MRLLINTCVLSLALLFAIPSGAQHRPQLMVLGSGHFDNPGRDMHNVKVDDVLTPERQRQIQQAVDALARFKPTRVAIEAPPSAQAKWSARYAAYRASKYTLTRDEREQIGLRLAAQMNLADVDAVDYTDGPPGPEASYDFPAYAAAHGRQAEMDGLGAAGEKMVASLSAYLATHTILECLQSVNTPQTRAEGNQMYFRFLRMDDDAGHPGASWVGGWHARNLIIVENVRRRAKPDDRVVLLFGAGHSYLLTQFATESGAFEMVEPNKFLGSPKP
jgi:hypothetical protein